MDTNLPKTTPPESPAERRQHYRDKMAAFLASKWSPPVMCPVCDSGDWTIGDVVDIPVRDPDWTPGYAGQVYAMVPVFCDNCTYTLWFNAVASGGVQSVEQIRQERAALEAAARDEPPVDEDLWQEAAGEEWSG